MSALREGRFAARQVLRSMRRFAGRRWASAVADLSSHASGLRAALRAGWRILPRPAPDVDRFDGDHLRPSRRLHHRHCTANPVHANQPPAIELAVFQLPAAGAPRGATELVKPIYRSRPFIVNCSPTKARFTYTPQ